MKKCKIGFPPAGRRLMVMLSMLIFGVLAVSAQSPVKGVIRDKDGKPVVGATITVKGQTTGTSTGEDGSFSIPAKVGDVLVVSSIGFDTHEIKYNGKASNLYINLDEKASSLDDVVVVGYGTVKKSDLTGAVGVVNVGNAKKTETYDIARSLQGQVAGVTVQGSGEPGGFVNIKVRGVSGLFNAAPLFVIDGVQIINGAPFDFPMDNIESIQVLKDATAAAIFGARGAAGVIIITTKKGRGGSLKLRYNAYYGFQNITKKLALTDRTGYQKITDAAETNAGLPLAPANDPTNAGFINNVNTDWQKAAFKTGIIQNQNVDFSGGDANTNYNVSMTYFANSATVQGGPGEPKYNRYNIDANMQSKAGILTFGAKFDFTHSHKQNLTYPHLHPNIGNEIVDLDRAIPTVPVYDSNRLGGFGGTTDATQKAIMLNIIGMNNLMNSYSDRDRFLGDAWAELEITKGLKYKINISYDRVATRDFFFEPKYDLGWYYVNNTAYETDSRGSEAYAIIENTLDYQLKTGKHKLEVLAGTSYNWNQIENITGIESGFNAPYFYSFNNGDPTTASVTSFTGVNTQNSYFGRLVYNYDDRYLVTVNGRTDGSSVFSPDNRWGFFPSVSAAWNISNEKFIHLPDAISFLKLRGGYGSLGNQNFGAAGFYAYTPYINSNARYLFGTAPNSGAEYLAPGSIQTQVADPTLKWETRTTSGAGVDMGFFNNKLLFTAEYYSNTAKNLIAQPPIPLSVGATNVPYVNAASLQNSGVEFSVSYKKQIGDFNLTIDANAHTLHNKVLQLGGTNDPIYGNEAKTEVGHEVGEIYGFVTQGIFQNAGDVTKHAVQPNAAPGDVIFKDVDGNDTINALDETYLGSAIPKIYYGLNIGLSYKDLDFSVAFQGNAGNKIVNGLQQTLMAGQYTNHSVDELNYWTPTNTNTNVPRPIIGDPNGNDGPSDRWVESGSYVKMQNAEIGYTFPSRTLLPTRVFHSARVYVSGQNLFTITKYKGYDPDIISDGLFSRGFDYGSFPNPRTISFGLQVGFN